MLVDSCLLSCCRELVLLAVLLLQVKAQLHLPASADSTVGVSEATEFTIEVSEAVKLGMI